MTNTDSKSRFWPMAVMYGGTAGFIVITAMLIGFAVSGFHSGAGSMAVGFLFMFIALSLIFFEIRNFRDQEQGADITFSKAILLGLATSLCAAIMYIFVWEIYLAISKSDFIIQYTDHLTEFKRETGTAGAELEAYIADMKKMVENYANPFYRIPVTFTEIFPIGLLVSIVSALALHNPKFWAKAV